MEYQCQGGSESQEARFAFSDARLRSKIRAPLPLPILMQSTIEVHLPWR